MNCRLLILSILNLASLLLSACATVDPDADFDRARQLIRSSTGVDETYDPESDELTTEQITQSLDDGLTVDEAVALALVNNRDLQAQFMRIGVAKADWVQSGLLGNPTLGFTVLFPEGGGRSFLAADLAQNLVEIWQLPIRTRIAQHELDAVVLDIASQAARLATETRKVYYRAVAANGLLAVAQDNVELVRKSYDAIKTKRQAGAASQVDENLALGRLHVAEVAVRAAKLESIQARQELAALLALDRTVTDLQLTDDLPAVERLTVSLQELITLARESRLDLQSLESLMRAAGVKMAFEKSQVFGDITAGAGIERNERRAGDGNIIDEKVGPTLSLEIPIFDQNQAQLARADYLSRQAMKTYSSVYLAIVQEIHAATTRAKSATESLTFYRDTLLPQAQKNQAFADEAYNAGQTTLLGLIELQRNLLEARKNYIETQRSAADAIAEVERAVGLPLEEIRLRVENSGQGRQE